MDQMTKADWDNILALAQLGAAYDSDGCSYSPQEETNDMDRAQMASLRLLRALVDQNAR